jgi:hypothetical protein
VLKDFNEQLLLSSFKILTHKKVAFPKASACYNNLALLLEGVGGITRASSFCEVFGNQTVCRSDMFLFTDSNNISILVPYTSFCCCHNIRPLFVVVSMYWRNVSLILRIQDQGIIILLRQT